MRKLIFFSLVGITSIAFAHAGWAAGHGGVFGSSGGFGGGHAAGGGGGGPGGEVGSRGGGVGSGRPVSSGRPAYYYSRGMHYGNSRIGQARSPFHQSPSMTRPDLRGNNSAARQAQTSGRPAFNRTTGHTLAQLEHIQIFADVAKWQTQRT
jgi:hypothetical protein